MHHEIYTWYWIAGTGSWTHEKLQKSNTYNKNEPFSIPAQALKILDCQFDVSNIISIKISIKMVFNQNALYFIPFMAHWKIRCRQGTGCNVHYLYGRHNMAVLLHYWLTVVDFEKKT